MAIFFTGQYNLNNRGTESPKEHICNIIESRYEISYNLLYSQYDQEPLLVAQIFYDC